MTYDWSGVVGQTSIVLAWFMSREFNLYNQLTSDLLVANNNVIIPECVCISAIALPAKVDA